MCVTSMTVYVALIILFNTIDLNYAAFGRCYFDSFTNWTERPLESMDLLITNDSCIDVKKKTMILGNGFDNDPDNGDAIKTLISTFISLDKYNVVLLNWAKESRGIGFGSLGYPSAVQNTITVAKKLADAIISLVELGLSTDILLVGHSLGAQLLGYCGRELIKRNLTIPTLIALDPARPGFDKAPPYPPVDTTCAGFVLVLHCDPGGFGLYVSLGHIDVWLNLGYYVNGPKRQPGCKKGYSPNEIGSGGNSCSHDRCWEVYNISMTDPDIFKVGKANDYNDFISQNGHFNITTYFGPEIDEELRGDFFCSTSATQPWGLGDIGLLPEDEACPSCQDSD